MLTYDEAVKAAGYDSHSDLDFDGETFDQDLPYYGQVLTRHVAFGSGLPSDPPETRYGKIANPSVHVALNQDPSGGERPDAPFRGTGRGRRRTGAGIAPYISGSIR